MALNEDERMVTRHKRSDYFLLNDGLDDEVSTVDRIHESDLESLINLSSSEILPSESASQRLNTSRVQLFNYRSPFSKWPSPPPVTSPRFEVTEVAGEWAIKRTRRRESTDRDIRCVYIDNKTGIHCPWLEDIGFIKAEFDYQYAAAPDTWIFPLHSQADAVLPGSNSLA
ncbi:hypothetical protein V1504DRAFT_466058 [Lipomyces starkeyi]